MSYRRFLQIIFLLFTAVVLGSCASILNKRYQEVTISTDNDSNQVYVDDKHVGTGKKVTTHLKRDAVAKEIRIEREGHETGNYAVIQLYKSPLYILSVIPFAVTIVAPLGDGFSKAYDYPRRMPEFTTGGTYIERKEGDKYIFGKSAYHRRFEIKTMEYYNFTSSQARDKPEDSGNQYPHSIVENEHLQFLVNSILFERGFMDTTQTVLKQKTNTLYIDVIINKMTTYKVYRANISPRPAFTYADGEFIWTLRDVYNQVLFEDTINITTDRFRTTTHYSSSFISGMVYSEISVTRNGLEKSLVEFLRQDEIQQFLPVSNEEEFSDSLHIEQGHSEKAINLSETVKACVTLKLEKSHASGFFINDHYILTNYHVVAGCDTVTIITNDGIETQGMVVRVSKLHDLAIIETRDVHGKYYIALDTTSPSDLGEEAYAIGTPSSIEFTQTISKGIISGRRVTSETDYIQTDARLNMGNSGGPLVDSNGMLIGVIVSKIIGENVEGIGFAIPADKIAFYLKLMY